MFELSSKYTGIPKWILTKTGSYKRNVFMPPREYEMPEDSIIAKMENLEHIRIEQMQENLRAQREKADRERKRQLEIEEARTKAFNERKRGLIEKEIEDFAKNVMSSMSDFTDEEIINNSMKLLYNEEAFDKLVLIYLNNTLAHLEEFEYRSVVRKALLRNIEEVSSRIEASHKEFPQVEAVKMIRL